MEVIDARTKQPVARDKVGAFSVVDQREYIVRAETPLTEVKGLLSVLPVGEGRVGTLCFENYVGLAEVGGARFRVKHSKLTDEAFEQMLDGVVAEVADLAFDYASPTELPFEREDLGTVEDVRYHALAYLRHVMRRVDGGESVLGQFLQIARNPSRRMDTEPRWTETSRATRAGPSTLLAIASHPEHVAPIDATSRLARTGIARVLRARDSAQDRMLFPTSVLGSARRESFDTHENRLVLHILRFASDLVAEFEAKPTLNPRLRDDLRAMREELDWMVRFDFLRDVSPMRIVPLQSTVLQRRDGYREFLGHYLRLSLSSALADDRDRWHALLDLKDSALLYEVWCFLAVKRVTDGLLGAPITVQLVGTEPERRKVSWAAKVVYAGGDELIYNRTYPRGSGSYSVTLRPDIVLRSRPADRWVALILDAKLKFDGDRLDALRERDPAEWDRAVAREDIYKMHTYRDAIREAVGAFVLFPGSKRSTFTEVEGGPPWRGVGAIPLVPGEESPELRELVASFLGRSASS